MFLKTIHEVTEYHTCKIPLNNQQVFFAFGVLAVISNPYVNTNNKSDKQV